MKYISAYCLLGLGGNTDPSEDDIAKFFKSINVETDSE